MKFLVEQRKSDVNHFFSKFSFLQKDGVLRHFLFGVTFPNFTNSDSSCEFNLDDSIRLSLELNNLGTQIKRQGSVNDDILKLQKTSLKEAQEVQDFVEDELQIEIELNKSMKEEYSKNMQFLLKMLLKSSKVSEQVEPFDSYLSRKRK